MASTIGSTIASFGAPFIPDLTDAANVQTALKLLYYGTGGTLNNNNGIHGALYTLYTGNPTLAGNVTITGTLTVNGTTTTLNSTTLSVDDKLIEIGAVTTPTNTTADGGGLLLFGATNKTILWDNANANWTTSENWNIASGKTLKINNVTLLDTNAPKSMATLMGYTSTVTANATTVLTNTSSYYQQFTGSSNQSVTLPVTSTLITGWTFHIVNNSTSSIFVTSSGGNAVITLIPGTTAMVTCIGTTLTTAADWEAGLTDFSTYTGSGDVVFSTSPTFTTQISGGASMNAFNATTTTLNIGGAVTSLSIGNTATAAQTVNMFTASTGGSTYNIATGATGSATTKALNIGTGGGASSTTNITMGSSNGGTFAVNSPTVTLGSATALNINGASPSIATTNNGTATVFNTNALGLNLGNAATTASLVGAATTLNIGNTTTSSQTVNMFTAATAGGTYNIATAASSSGTKAINIGTGGTTGSTTTINIGTAGGTGTVNINGTANIGKVLLQTVTTSAGASTLTFSSIPQTYESLEVLYTVGTSNTAATTVSIQFAGDTSANYGYSFQSVSGSSTTNTTAPSYNNGFDQTSILVPMNHPSTSTIGHIEIHNYNSTAGAKIGTFNGGYDYLSDGFTNGTFHWKNRTTAVTSMTLTFAGTVTGQVVTAQLFGLN